MSQDAVTIGTPHSRARSHLSPCTKGQTRCERPRRKFSLYLAPSSRIMSTNRRRSSEFTAYCEMQMLRNLLQPAIARREEQMASAQSITIDEKISSKD